MYVKCGVNGVGCVTVEGKPTYHCDGWAVVALLIMAVKPHTELYLSCHVYIYHTLSFDICLNIVCSFSWWSSPKKLKTI